MHNPNQRGVILMTNFDDGQKEPRMRSKDARLPRLLPESFPSHDAWLSMSRSTHVCPKCLEEFGAQESIPKDRKSERVHEKSYAFSEVEVQHFRRIPSKRAKKPWFLPKFIHRMFAAPSPATNFPWFVLHTYVRCSYHGQIELEERAGRRQFGWLRAWFIEFGHTWNGFFSDRQ